MNSKQRLVERDMFSPRTEAFAAPVVLEIKGIQAPMTIQQKKKKKLGIPPAQNFHIPSFKNAKVWITKMPNGKPLKKPILITSPEFQEWMSQAVRSLESQLLCLSRTGSGATRPERSRLFAILSSIPVDDSVNDWPEGSWKVVRVPPGQEGCRIEIERLR